MRVELLQHTPDFLHTIWTAARTCYSSQPPSELWQNPPARDSMLFLVKRIINSGHHSVVEHCSMTYAVEEVSRTLLAQYSRHRIGISLSVQSQRYVAETSERNNGLFTHIVPPSIMASEEAHNIYLEEVNRQQRVYDQLVALGIKKEDARFILPGAKTTNFVTTVNLRSLIDLYHKRVIVSGAQWEIKEMVTKMCLLIMAKEPWLEEYFNEVKRG